MKEGPLAACKRPFDQNGSDSRLVATAPFVVQTDAHDVVGRLVSLRSDRPEAKAAERFFSLVQLLEKAVTYSPQSLAKAQREAAG
jgi:hypothetical protein